MIHKAKVPYTPAEAGYDEKVLDRLDHHFQECMLNRQKQSKLLKEYLYSKEVWNNLVPQVRH